MSESGDHAVNAPGVSAAPGRRRRVGVIGTFVWDVIPGHSPAGAAVEGWGGIAYALAALDAALISGWEIVPLIKVGEDLAVEARSFLGELRHLAPDAELVETPGVNNRSELRYLTPERREERLSGHTPGWSWEELGPRIATAGLDALYVNFLSGWELDLPTAVELRRAVSCPIYVDLHMLVWQPMGAGVRTVTPLPSAGEWYRCFDLLQVNEEELVALASDPAALAMDTHRAGVSCSIVTRGSAGVHAFAAPGFDRLQRSANAGDEGRASTAPSVLAVPSIPAPEAVTPDPTGCGDVWGATFFGRLLMGDRLVDALRAASAAAASNVAYRGASVLGAHLRGASVPRPAETGVRSGSGGGASRSG